MDSLIQKIKEEILIATKPTSVFLYGSYNTLEYLPGVSDLEIGVLRKNPKDAVGKVLRKIAERHSSPKVNVRIYGYNLNAIKNGDINSPFTKSVFIRHLILTSKTIWGEKIMEYLSLPAITTLDAYREASFSTMRALAGLFSLRAGNLKEAQEMACKSCLFATLSLEYLIGEFPIGFGNIVKLSKKIKIGPKEKKLVNIAYKMRQGKKYFSEDKMYDFIFEIMTYSAQIAEVRIKEKLEKGNKILVK